MNENCISGNDLAALIGVTYETYDSLRLPRFGHTFVDPRTVLSEDYRIEGLPNFKSVTGGKYNSGEVWADSFYGVIYLYVGKTLDGKDVTLQIGGDSINAGQLEQGIINAGGQNRVFFHKRLFP